MANYFVKKDIQRLIADAQDPHVVESGGYKLKRTLGAFNLTMLGIGAIIGAGIFSLTGTAAAFYAGPGIIYSFMIGGLLCALAGLCYAEMAAMVPVSGSAYTYSYATMGEFIAWIIGWDLVLEYGFCSVTVAASWSGYFYSLLNKTLGIQLGDSFIRFTKGPWELVTLSNGVQAYGYWNLPATLIALVLAGVLFRGMQESTWINNCVVIIKVSVILLFIGLGLSVVDPSHWIANPTASGLARLVPPYGVSIRNGREMMSFGWPGVLTGAGVVFFAYIGFDAISTTAQECKRPTRDLPIGILASLVICTLLYILMALVITGVVPYQELGVPDPIAVGIDQIVSLHGWSNWVKKFFTFGVKLGALAGLTSVVLVMMMGQTRIFYAMSKDGLLPWLDRLHSRYRTPYLATITAGLFVSICSGIMPMSLVGELVSIGTLLAFVLVCAGVLILRLSRPDLERPFKTPLYWFVAPAGIAACLWVMSGLPQDTWIRLGVWLMMGLMIYFGYGLKHSKLRRSLQATANSLQLKQEKSLKREKPYNHLSKLLVMIGATTLGLSACFGPETTPLLNSSLNSGNSGLSSGDTGTIRIGEVGSMTGSDATFGLSTHRGILLAVSEVNSAGGIHGRKLELVTFDDQGKPSEAVAGTTNLITQQKVQAILGEVASTLSIAMAPIAEQFKIPMISPSSINSKVTQQGTYTFRVCFLDRFQSKVMAEFALNRLHAKRVAILRDIKSDYSRDSAEIFAEIFKKGGGEIVIDQSYSAGDIDFKSQLTAIRGANPDLLLVPGYYTEIGLIARQTRELGILAPMLGGDGWDSPKLKEIGGQALNGSYFVSHFAHDDPSPQIQEFIQKYKKTFNIGAPDGLAALGYDAALVLADALKRTPPTSLALSGLRNAIASTQGFQGVTGKISIDLHHNAVKSAVVFKLGDGGNAKVAETVLP